MPRRVRSFPVGKPAAGIDEDERAWPFPAVLADQFLATYPLRVCGHAA